MIIYLDLIFVVNLVFDFALLLTVDLLLKRKSSYKRTLLGALSGELSMITIFINFNRINLFLLKNSISLIMSIISFGFKDIKYTFYNVIYLYLVGTILGGFTYYLYNEFQIDMTYSFRYIIILILSPLVLLIYYRLTKRFKNNYNNRYDLLIKYDGLEFRGTGYLDSGNKLVSPISGKPIILVEKEYIKNHKLKLLPVPFNALNHHGIVNCFKPDEVYVNGKSQTGVLIGISEVKFNIEGVNALLNARMEGL